MSYQTNVDELMERYEAECKQEELPFTSGIVRGMYEVAQDRGEEIERLRDVIIKASRAETPEGCKDVLTNEILNITEELRARVGRLK